MRPKFLHAGYRTHGGRKHSVLDFFDIFAFLLFIAGIAGVIRFFVFMPYTVEGTSMAPTFHDKDFIVVDKMTPKYGSLKRGDVVVFVPPGKDIPFIKRIVGLPGETVKLQSGKVYICSNTTGTNVCKALTEPYIASDIQTDARCGVTTFDVKDGYFVMGDNRGYSTDSRCCFGLGCTSGSSYTVMQDRVIGKVSLRMYPSPTSFNNESAQYKTTK